MITGCHWLQSHCWMHTFVWEVCCMRKASLCIHRDISCVFLRSLRPIISSMVVLNIKKYWSMQFTPQFTRHIQIMMSLQVEFSPQSIRKKHIYRLTVSLLSWSATAVLPIIHLIKWLIWIPRGNLFMFIYIGRYTFHNV